jgi:hypothetical protein
LVGALGSRAIGSYLREFETLDPDGAVKGANDLADVVEALREFFLDSYEREVVPLLEQHHVIPSIRFPRTRSQHSASYSCSANVPRFANFGSDRRRQPTASVSMVVPIA